MALPLPQPTRTETPAMGWFKSKGLTGPDGLPKPGVKAQIPTEAARGRFD